MILKSFSNQFHPDYENNSKHCSNSNIFKHKANYVMKSSGVLTM